MLLLDFDFFSFVVCLFWESKPQASQSYMEWEREDRDTTLRLGRLTVMVGDERRSRSSTPCLSDH